MHAEQAADSLSSWIQKYAYLPTTVLGCCAVVNSLGTRRLDAETFQGGESLKIDFFGLVSAGCDRGDEERSVAFIKDFAK